MSVNGPVGSLPLDEQVNRELERRVAERTVELEATIARLRESESRYRGLIQPLQAAIYTCDKEGRVSFYNEAAAALWGREPEVGKDLWCGSWRIYQPDGSPLPLNACPMAVTIREGRPAHGQEIIIERPDGSRSYVLPYPDPLYDESGAMIGAVNFLVDLTERRQSEEQWRQQARVLETVNQINASLAAELNLEKLIQAVTDAATEVSGAQFGAFFYNVENKQGESYMLYSLSGVPRAAFEQFPMPRNTAIFGPTFRGERVIRLDDVTQDPQYGQSAPYHGMPKGHLPVRSYLAVPVISRTGEVIGGLFLGHSEPGVFTEQAEQLVTGVASQAAIALDNARIYEAERAARAEAETAQQRLALLAQAGEVLIDSPDDKAILSHLTQVIVPALADWWIVDLLDEDGLIHRLVVVHKDPAKAALAARLQHNYPVLDPQGNHTIARMIRQGRSWFDPRVEEGRFVAEARDEAHLALLRELGFASEMVVPLIARGRTLGTLTFARASETPPYEPADLRLAEELARRTALAIDNARLYSSLRESEERFRVTLQNSPVVVYNTDRALNCTWMANPHPDFPLEQLTGSQAEDRPALEQAGYFLSLKKQVLESGLGVRKEISFSTPSGGQTWDITVEPLRAETGEITGLTVAALDITERKRTEERVARLQAVTAALSAALTPGQVYEVIAQKVASALDANTGALYSVSEDGQWLERVQAPNWGEEDVAAASRFHITAPYPVAVAARTGEAVWLEVAHGLGQAETMAYEATANLPLWFEGRALGSLNFSFTTTQALKPEEREFLLALARLCAQALERARLYQEAQQLNAELEQRVADRTAELRRSVEELDQFTYAASHDLKAPLRAVKNLSSWIAEDAADTLPEPSKEHLAKMQGRIKRMEKLLDDLLAYSRVGRDYYKIKEAIRPHHLVEEIIDLLAPPPGFTIIVQETIPPLTTYRVLLELVFKNLIENAIKYHDRPDGRITISAQEVGGFLEFSVADDGPGIEATYHERIFQIFQTLRPRDESQGTGVGLALVKKAIESQGGSISIISAKGQGTTFRFTWPR